VILPQLPAFIQGEWQPHDNDERLALLGGCESEGRYTAASRLCADAFAADPDLAGGLTTQCIPRAAREPVFPNRIAALNAKCRYRAARCAALAGCAFGKDATKLSEAERANLRRKALGWLEADLAVWSKAVDSGRRAHRDRAKEMFTLWQEEPDLAGVRDGVAVSKLPDAEREQWQRLWADVAALLAADPLEQDRAR